MKKVVLIPDSFKGSISSAEACQIMERAIHGHFPNAEVISIPVADGGEGSVDCFLTALGGKRVSARVQGPWGEEMDSFYGVLPDGTAVVEVAACVGLPLVGAQGNPEETTTYGVGELIAHALRAGCRRVIIGLGGSSTNDGGAGMAAALGVKFYTLEGEAFVPTGGTLHRIDRIDLAGLLPELRGAELIAMCDIDNPLHGPEGAAYVFAPQKGADDAMVKRLDAGLCHFARVLDSALGKRVADMPGAGAAGGLGAGLAAFCNAQLRSGIETVLDTVHFEQIAAGADLVISGEGKIDTQSLRGKVVIGVANRTKAMGIPLLALVGDIGDGIERAYEMGVDAIFSINSVAVPFSQAKLRSKHDMAQTMDNILRFYQAMLPAAARSC